MPVSVNHSAPLAMIGGDVVPGLDVVDVGGLAPESLSAPGTADAADGRPALPSSEAISAVSSPQTNAPAPSTISMSNLKPRPRILLAQQAVLARLLDRPVQALHRQRILGAHVDDALAWRPSRSRR